MLLLEHLKFYPYKKKYIIFLVLSTFILPSIAVSKSFKTKKDFENSTLVHFRDSIIYIQKSFSVEPKDVNINKKGYQTGKLSPEEHRKILNNAKLALQSSYKVSKDDLDAWDKSLFYKTLSDNYFNKFQKGLILYVDAWETGNPVKGIQANKLLDEWGKYYRKYRKKLL